MEHGATFDPLAALEAEYAAVVAQNTPSVAASATAPPTGNAESAGSDSEDEESAAVGGFESYALLPSSPCHSDAASGTGSDYQDNAESEERSEKRSPRSEAETEETNSNQQRDAGVQEDKRRAIMQSMQQVKLRPPPWAEAANLTDDELVNLVQRQLGLKSNST
jgi:hypothetical protein